MNISDYRQLRLALREVCRIFNLTEEQMRGRCRETSIVTPRQIFCYITRLTTTVTLTDISKMIDGDEHTKVKHNSEVVQALIDTSDEVFMTYWNKFLLKADKSFIPTRRLTITKRDKQKSIMIHELLSADDVSDPVKKYERPKAVYGNIKSPYGVYSDEIQNK